jgi:hypothetical protein
VPSLALHVRLSQRERNEEERRRRKEDGGQRTEDRGQRSEVRGQRSEVDGVARLGLLIFQIGISDFPSLSL